MWRNLADAPVSEAGCWRFKSSHPHQIFVGVAQLAEREPATLEVGSSNLLADSRFFARLAEWILGAGSQPLSGRFDSVSVLQVWQAEKAEVAQSGRRTELKPPSFEGSIPSFGIKGFLRGGKCSVRSHKPRLAGSVTQTRNQIDGALGKFGEAVSFSS